MIKELLIFVVGFMCGGTMGYFLSAFMMVPKIKDTDEE